MSTFFPLIGEKMVIRNVSFKPFCSRDYHDGISREVRDCSFESELCEWIASQFPAVNKFPGNSPAERIQAYLNQTSDQFESMVHQVYLFVKTEGVTHYVSALSLGAAMYSVSVTNKTAVTAGVKTEVGNDLVGGVGAGVKRSKEKTTVVSKNQHIGNIEAVERGKEGEAVIGYEILPVYTLLRHEKLKEVLQRAIQLYLKRESEYLCVAL